MQNSVPEYSWVSTARPGDDADPEQRDVVKAEMCARRGILLNNEKGEFLSHTPHTYLE